MKQVVKSFCGADCEACRRKEAGECLGCQSEQSNALKEKCEVRNCAKQKKIDFCGECDKIPCEKLQKLSFQKDGKKQGETTRIERCQEWKGVLVKAAREGIEAVSYCGHHCDFCWMAQWCGGCRSTYNCCSYATIMADGKCPNVVCCQQKGIEGCYACEQLEGCQKGYYSNTNEYAAKAAAMFIRQYGLASYKKTLADAISTGMLYPKDLDRAGSVGKAMAVLEKYQSK